MTNPAHPRPIAGGQRHAAQRLGDELLAKLVGRGSEHAFAALCERHSNALHRYCLSILRNEHDAQDALQSTMTQAYAALRACERDVSLRAWLFRIAHNESVTILRKRARQADPSQTGAARASDPHSVFEERARLSQLVADLHALPERQRATLVMRELSGLGIAEIARVLDITTAAAKQSLFEARNSMRDFDRGRAMECEEVQSAISAHDRRILRGRRISAHLNACESCSGFRSAIGTREADLHALVPAPPAPAIALALVRALGGGRWSTRGAGAGPPSGASQELLVHGSASALLKIGASVAVIAVGTAGTLHIARRPAHPYATGGPVAIATKRSSRMTIPRRDIHGALTAIPAHSLPTTSRPAHRRASNTTTASTTIAATSPAAKALAPPSRSATDTPSADVHTAPSDGQTVPKPTTQVPTSHASTPDGGSTKPGNGQGYEDSSPSEEHGPPTGEHGGHSAGNGNEREQGEQGERSSLERGSAGSRDDGGNEQGQSDDQPAHGNGGGKGRSGQSDE